jgi:RecB family exonuclease
VITPRRTRLVRVADLQQFRRAIVRLALEGAESSRASRAVLVPTRAAARQLARLEPEAAWPALVTRDQLYDRLHAALDRPRLTPFAREAAMRDAAARAAAAGAPPPFALRPGLVAEMVRFYDQLRRQQQSVDRFEALLLDSLAGNPDDRGADRLVRQTRFLAAAYRAYEAALASSDALDEHGLRERAVARPAREPLRHVVVAVGDWIADPDGLFPADFDLLTRLPGLEAIDVVATTGTLASGFHQRIHEWLPGLEEVEAAAEGPSGTSSVPSITVPDPAQAGLAFVRRDREEELTAIARRVKHDPAAASATAIVFNRPLPYVYLAREVFESAGLAYEAHDALPLAAEPFTAAVDLVVDFALSGFTRASGVALLRSPHFAWAREGRDVSRCAIAALDRLLSESRYLGELDRLRHLADEWSGEAARRDLVDAAQPAYEAVLEAAIDLEPLLQPAPLSSHFARLAAFLGARASSLRGRHERARAAVAVVLGELAAASAAHGDPEGTIEAIGPELQRWIEEQTFVPEAAEAGLQLVDAQAARFTAVRQLFIVGLVEGEWPERARRSIFYPAGLLGALGWPPEADRRGADLGRFVDLLRSPVERVELSTFLLDDEALVEPSALIDEAANVGLAPASAPPASVDRVFDYELLSLEPTLPDLVAGPAAHWLRLRLSRTPGTDPAFHGETGPLEPRPLSVSAVETYLACPFKYYARHVLALEDEPDDDEVMDPRRQGQFVHRVFERFFREWEAAGGGAIAPERLGDAHALFERIADTELAALPEAEAALERTRLLGSPVAPGLADAVFRMEAERPVAVVRRELECRLEGRFTFEAPDGPRRIALRGVADRVDLLADGTFRLIDYKLGRAPQKSRALQLPIYALCVEQRLGGRWTLGEAAYIAFREPKRIVPLFTARSDRDQVLAAAAGRLVAAVDAIQAGHFPPRPEDVFLCGFCSYTAVCRTDYE